MLGYSRRLEPHYDVGRPRRSRRPRPTDQAVEKLMMAKPSDRVNSDAAKTGLRDRHGECICVNDDLVAVRAVGMLTSGSEVERRTNSVVIAIVWYHAVRRVNVLGSPLRGGDPTQDDSPSQSVSGLSSLSCGIWPGSVSDLEATAISLHRRSPATTRSVSIALPVPIGPTRPGETALRTGRFRRRPSKAGPNARRGRRAREPGDPRSSAIPIAHLDVVHGLVRVFRQQDGRGACRRTYADLGEMLGFALMAVRPAGCSRRQEPVLTFGSRTADTPLISVANAYGCRIEAVGSVESTRPTSCTMRTIRGRLISLRASAPRETYSTRPFSTDDEGGIREPTRR